MTSVTNNNWGNPMVADLYYLILNIIREESKRYEYKPNKEQNIVVIDEDGNEYARISMDKFMTESTRLLDTIKNNR
jgi:HpaII restriction endonuclease.